MSQHDRVIALPPAGNGTVLVTLAALLVIFYGVGIVGALAVPQPDGASLMGLVSVVGRLLIGLAAIRGMYPTADGAAWKKVIIFVMAFLPLLVWVALFLAARAVASHPTGKLVAWTAAGAALVVAAALLLMAPAF